MVAVPLPRLRKKRSLEKNWASASTTDDRIRSAENATWPEIPIDTGT